MRTFAYTRLRSDSGASDGPADVNAAEESAVRLLSQDLGHMPPPLFPVLAFAFVKTKTYSRAGIDATMQLRAAMYLAFCSSGASSVGA